MKLESLLEKQAYELVFQLEEVPFVFKQIIFEKLKSECEPKEARRKASQLKVKLFTDLTEWYDTYYPGLFHRGFSSEGDMISDIYKYDNRYPAFFMGGYNVYLYSPFSTPTPADQDKSLIKSINNKNME